MLYSGIQLGHGQHVHGGHQRGAVPGQVPAHPVHRAGHRLAVDGDILLREEELKTRHPPKQ